MTTPTQQQAFAFPLSFAQQRLWFLDQYEGGSATYNITMALRAEGRIDIPALEQALNTVVARHETLRTTFRTMDKKPVQVIHPELIVHIPVEDVSSVTAAERLPHVSEKVTLDSRRAFDLTKGPLVRLKLYQLAPDDHVLHVNIHHIIADGWSMDVFVRELIAAYQAGTGGTAVNFPELPIQYADYAQWQRDWLQGEALDVRLNYWKEKLAGVPRKLDLPSDRPRPPLMTFQGRLKSYPIGKALKEQLDEIGHTSRATLFMTMLAAFSAAVSYYTKEEDVVIASPIANRNRPEIEPLIGFFVNTLPLRVNLSGNPTFKELLKQTEQTCHEAYQNQDLPFEKLVSDIGLVRDLSRAPLAQIAFAHQNIRIPELDIAGVHFSPFEVQTGSAKTDLVVMVEETKDGLLAKVEYNTDLFDEGTVDEIMGGYIRLLRKIAEDPSRPVAELIKTAELRLPEGGSPPGDDPVYHGYLRKTNLTESQLHLWLGQKLIGQVPLYNLKTVYTLHLPVDQRHFQDAFQKIVDSNENLRTVFYEKDGIPYQKVLDELLYPVECLDFSGEANPTAAAAQWVAGQADHVFDLSQPSFDSKLIKIAEDCYQWYFCQHHILSDGWSIYLAYSQLTDNYRAAMEGRLNEVPPQEPYSRYVADEHAFRQTERYRRARAYWARQMADRPEAPTFYGIHPPRQSTAIERVSRLKQGEVIRRINAIREHPDLNGFAEQALKYNYFLALYALFISRVTGQRSVSIGVPIHNRRAKEHIDIQGLFMHIVPLVIPIDENETLISLMRQIKRLTFNAMKHGQYVVRNSPRDPAYDVLFNYQMWRMPKFYDHPFELNWLHSGHTFESCGLQVHDFEKEVRSDERLTFAFEFKREIFDESTRERAMDQFFQLMESSLDGLDRPMKDLAMTSAQTHPQMLSPLNNTAAQYPSQSGVHQLFAQQARRTPDRVATACGEESVTYAELNARANRLAHYLRSSGIGPNHLVGISCRPGLDMITGLLGILKSGAAYVPLDPAYPADRLRTMIGAADLTALLVHEPTRERYDFAALAEGRTLRVICQDTERKHIAAGDSRDPDPLSGPDDLIYMIFTSGSTGTPKGAGVYHRGFTNLVWWFTKTFGFAGDDSVLLISSLSFDLTQKNLYAPLLVGGTLHFTDACYYDPRDIIGLVAAKNVTWLNCTPSAFYPLLEQAKTEGFADLNSLRHVFLGGEPIDPARLRPWLETENCVAQVVNTYGPTECTDVTTYHVMDDRDAVAGGVPIGRPIANTQHYILDPYLRPVPNGVPGELWIAGDCVGAGYVFDAAMTEAKFIANPFGEGRLYRTGDIVRMAPGGAIAFVGRRDDQVKIRGFRIELGDITAALNRHPMVKASVVIAAEDTRGQKSLAAYVVGENGSLCVQTIQNDIKNELPEYMVPQSITPIAEIPLTPNGKVDRRALPEPAALSRETEQSYAAPRNEIEEKLAAIWKEATGSPRVGIHDNFFDLGGHSLMATQIVAMVQEEFAVDMPVRTLFEQPTVAGVAEAVRRQQESGETAVVGAIPVMPRERTLPLSHEQQHMWVMENMTGEKATFNMPVALRVEGPLDRACLQRVLDEVLARHEILRTTIAADDSGGYRQVIHPAGPLTIQDVSVDGSSPEERFARCRDILKEEAARPFDVNHGPVFRVHVFRLDDEDHVVLLNVHHMAFDAFSANIILEEIRVLYRAFRSGQPSPLPALRVQYADYAVWQRERLQGEMYQQQQQYWQQRLRGAKSTLPLPTDRPRPPVQTYEGSVERFRLDPQTVQAVEALGQEQSATLFMTLLTCFAVTMAEWTKEQDIVLASPVAGRQHTDLAGMIGLMVNLIPLRVELEGNPVFRDLLSAVRETCLEAQQYQDVTFDHILEVTGAEHNPGRSPFSQVVFNVQHAPDSHFEEDGLRFSPLEYDTDAANTDLAVVMDRDRSGGMEAVVSFNTDLFDRATVRRLINRFQAVLAAAATEFDGRLSALCRAGGLDADVFLESQKKNDPTGFYREHSNLTEHELVLWAGQQLDTANPVYNSTITYRMPEPIDITHFRRAFQIVVDQHDALRTVIRMQNDVPQRHVIDRLEYNVIYQDFSAEADPDGAAQDWIDRQSKTAFALNEVLFRCALLKVADDDFIWYMSQHHIITDGWSQVLVYQAMSDYYRQSLAGEIVPRVKPQFADYARQEQAYVSSARYAKDAAYWQEILGRKRDALSFYGRVPAKRGTAMQRISRRLGEDLSEKIHAFVTGRQSERNTAEAIGFNLFLAVFAVYLWRVSGRTTFPVGIPLHNRRQKEMKDVMGLLMRVVPLPVELDPEQTLSELMHSLKRQTLKAMQHGQYLINNNHKDPVYDVLLNYHTWQGAKFHTCPLSVEWRHPMQAFESLALNVHDMERAFEESRSNIQIDFDFHRDVFDAGQSEQAIAHFRQLLTACIEDPDRPLRELTLLSDEEERRILVEWNDTDMPLPATTIHRLIEQQAADHPDAEALRFDGESMTYRQLNERANQLAAWLRDQGVDRDQLVGICMERSFEMVIGLLAIVKAGGAYVPVDPSYPADRIAFMLEDSGVRLLLTQSHLASTLPEHQARVFPVDAEGETLDSYGESDLSVDIKPDDLAYMIYTSGSTGKPKGAMNTHRAILNRLVWMQREYQINGSDRILQKTPFSFDVSVWEFFWPLMYGATLVIARPEGHKDSAYLRDLIRSEAITTLHFVPSMLQLFLEESQLEELTSLKRVICSGEALSTEVQRKFFSRCSFAQLHNLYGPTEAAIDVTYYPCRPDDERPTVPIGRPVANTQIYILDTALNPVPAGVPGELHIGGIQLARGYHNRPDLTAEKFIPDPFRDEPQARLYKTGDLARYLPDGQIEFLGRLDHQVKIRGFRIELGEIETTLLRYQGIKECVVVARKDTTGTDSLVAYLVSDGEQPAVEDVRDFLMESLPDYMVPAVMMFIDEMPLSPNGKLDRKALPEPQASRVGLRKEYTAPRNELEERLAMIFRELLGVDKVGIHDNFFELGGHSLQAIRLISRIRVDLQTELPLRIFFESSDVAQLAVRIEEAREQQSRRPRLTLEPVSRDQRLPLAFTQKRLWILDQLDPDNSTYNMPTAIGIKGPFRPELFERIFNSIIERHEVLRTTFAEENGQPYIAIVPELRLQLPVTDLRHVPADTRREEAWRIATEEASQPFDLTRGPLVRARALRLDEDEHVLMFTTHHIITDGWSIAVFVEEIQQLYTAFSSNLPSPLPPLSIQFADYAYWQNEWFKGEEMRRQMEYWKNKMEGAPALLELPTDRVRPAVEGYAGQDIHFDLDKQLTEELKNFAKKHDVTLFMVLHAAFLMLLARYSRQEDIVIGTPTANRNFCEVEPLIGFFVNTLLLRVDVSGDPRFADLLRRVKQTDIEAFEQQHVPFEHLLEELKPERSLSYSPWFQVMFALQNTPPWDHRQIKDLEFSDFGYEGTTAKFDLSLDIHEDEGMLHGLMQYKTELFDASTIERMIAHYRRLLTAIARDPSRRLSEYRLTDERETRVLLKDANNTAVDYPLDNCIHQLIEDQVRRTPDAVAVRLEDQCLTYAQLNHRANVLAHYLRQKGIVPGAMVGVCMERSTNMIVSLLAVLKAGGAYVPLDPGYPTERVQFMIEDSGLAVLLTSQQVYDERSLLLHERVDPVCLDRDWTAIEQEYGSFGVQAPNGYPLNSGNVAYVIYTSGSTGQPKGVQIEHRSLVNYACWARDAYEITAEDSFLQFASVSFDAAAEEIFATLITGATLVLRTEEMIASADAFMKLLDQWGITVMELPTAYWHQWVADLVADPNLTIPPRLRVLAIGGERALPEKVRQWHRRVGARTLLINTYGPTETTIASTYHKLPFEQKEDTTLREVPIGRPVANTQAYILDERMCPVPVGIPGELYIGGVGLARGYLNREDLTAERFVHFRPDEKSEVRVYRTGDICRYLPDGTIEYRGRADDQVKIRGFRIELGEIESVLAQYPDVTQCAVLVKEPTAGNKQLVAFVAGLPEGHSSDDIRNFLRDRLPGYMVPATCVCLPELPLSGAGKINRQALHKLEVAHEASANYVAPRDEQDEIMARIWQEVLGIERIGIHDNFFDLGGHSLIATQLVSRILHEFGVRMPLLQLFQGPTIAAMSDYVGRQPQQGTAAVSIIAPQERPDRIPVTLGQARLWSIEQRNPGLPTYNMPAAFQVKGDFDVDILRRVVSEMVRRHEALRTTFKEIDGEVVQVIHEDVVNVVDVVDLTSLSDNERDEQARRLSAEELMRPFDLTKGPLLRVRAFKVRDREFLLTLVMHHSISDGWSVDIISRELAILYECYAHNRPSILPELPIQFADFAIWHRNFRASEEYKKQLDYWSEQMRGAPELLNLKTDKPRPAVKTYQGDSIEVLFEREFTTQLKQLCREEGITLNTLLYAALAVVMRHNSGQDDMVLGTSIATRNRREIEDLIGLFTNNLALRIDLSGEPRFSELLRRAHRVCLDGFAHQDVPISQVIELSGKEVRRDYHPLFQVTMVLQNNSANTGWQLPEQSLEISAMPNSHKKAKYDLTISFEEVDGAVGMTFNFSTDIFTLPTGKRMAGEIRKVLAQAITDRQMVIGDMLSGREKAKVELLPAAHRPETNETSALVTIQAPPATGERKYPLFCVHPVGGNVFSYMPLGRHFGPQQPMYGLQSVGIDGERKPLASVEEMARHYVNQIRTIQPKGPYHLFGWSFGGVVSYEMARQLTAEGDEVALLAMVDSFVPTQHKYQVFKAHPDDSTLIGYLVEHLEGMFGCSLKVRKVDLSRMEREDQLQHVLDRAHEAGILPGSFDRTQMNRFFNVYKANHLAFCRYEAQSYDGDIHMFRPKKQLFVLSRANVQAWNRLTQGRVEVTQIPGDHYTVMQSANAAAIAAQLRERIGIDTTAEGAS